MDDLADLVWQSAGVKKPTANSSQGVPLSQLAAGNPTGATSTGPVMAPFGASPMGMAMGSNSPGSRTASPMNGPSGSSPRFAGPAVSPSTVSAIPSMTPPSSITPQYSPSSGSRCSTPGPGASALGLSGGPSASGTSGGDPFGNLVSFGGATTKPAASLSLAEQMRLKQQQQQQQQQQQHVYATVPQPQMQSRSSTPIGGIGAGSVVSKPAGVPANAASLGGADLSFLDALGTGSTASQPRQPASPSGFAAFPTATSSFPPLSATKPSSPPTASSLGSTSAPPTDPWDALLGGSVASSNSGTVSPATQAPGGNPSNPQSAQLLDDFFGSPKPIPTAQAAPAPAPSAASASAAGTDMAPKPSTPVAPISSSSTASRESAAQAQPAQATQQSSDFDQKLAMLVDRGFDPVMSAEALRASSGNLEMAVDMILSDQSSRRSAGGRSTAGGGGLFGKAASFINKSKEVALSKAAELKEQGARAVLADVVSVVQTKIEQLNVAGTGAGAGRTSGRFGSDAYEDDDEDARRGVWGDQDGDRTHGLPAGYRPYSDSGPTSSPPSCQAAVAPAAQVASPKQTTQTQPTLDIFAESASANGGMYATTPIVPPMGRPKAAATSQAPPTSMSSAARSAAAPATAPVSVPAPKTRPTPIPCTTMVWEEVQHHKTLGNDAYKRGQYHDAVAEYAKAISLLPTNHMALIPLHNNRAAAELKTGEYKECVADTEAVYAIVAYYGGVQGEDKVVDPASDTTVTYADCIKALLRQAAALEAMEKYQQAKEVFAGVVAHDSRNKVAMDGMARCSRALAPKPVDQPDPTPPVATGLVAEQAKKPAESMAAMFDPLAEPEPKPPSSNLPEAKPMETHEVAQSTAVQEMRAAERLAEAEADKAFEMKDEIDAKILAWKKGKETNLRALLSSLNTIVWPELNLASPALSELITPQQVKVKYMKAIGKLHPDKLKSDDVAHKMVANAAFAALNEAWDAFRAQNGM